MAKVTLFPRDEDGQDAKFLSAGHTDLIHDIVEALVGMDVAVSIAAPGDNGQGTLIVTRNGARLTIKVPNQTPATQLTQLSLYDATAPGGPTTLGVANGTVAGLVPSGMAGGAPLTFAVGAAGIVYASVAVDATGIVSNCVIQLGAGSSAPANTSGALYYLIGSYGMTDGALVLPPPGNGSPNLALAMDTGGNWVPEWN